MISNTLIELINNCSKIALAVSGGSDSMAMLYWFINNVDKSKYYVINIEHGIRGEESTRDSNFVIDYCRELKIPCISKSVNALTYAAKHRMPLEQAARVLRHEIFAQEAVTTADYVALAHHKCDQAETIFMHIARGSGLNGLCGMSQVDGYIIRPLLDISKINIIQYIADNNIPYLDDSTNSDNTYNRNYTRNVIFPTAEVAYPQFSANLVRLGQKANEAMEFIHSLLPQIEVIDNTCLLDIKTLPAIVAKASIQRAATLIGVSVDIEEKHLTACLELIKQPNGSRLMLPHNLRAYHEYGLLALTTNAESDNNVYKFDIGHFSFIYGDYIITYQDGEGNFTNLIDYDKLPKDATIRTARPKDKIRLSYGTKSLGDYFTDKKVPKRLRGCLPIIAHGSNVIAIADWAVGIEYAPDSKTNNYIAINYMQKDKIYD